MQWSYAQAGVGLPRTSQAQRYAGRQVPLSQAQPGDLVTYRADASHVGMYVGNGQVIHAPYPGAPVRYDPVGMMPVVVGRRRRLTPRGTAPYDRERGWSRACVGWAWACCPGVCCVAVLRWRLRRRRRRRTARAGTRCSAVLDRRAAAVLDRDEPAYRATGRTGAPRRRVRRTSRDVPLAAWSYRVTGLHRSGDRATADAELRYRIEGYDKAPVVAARTLSLTRADGTLVRRPPTSPPRTRASSCGSRGRSTVVRGEHSLVLGVGQSGERAARTTRISPTVPCPPCREAWGDGLVGGRSSCSYRSRWTGMAGLLGAPASGYRGIAAVTTGEAGGSAKAPADRIIVNPDAYGVLGDFGKQVVLTHETTHVATRAPTTAATPLWLSEGYADWVGYRGTGRTAAQAAPELARAVRGRARARPRCRATRTSGSPATRGGWRGRTRAAGWPAG